MTEQPPEPKTEQEFLGNSPFRRGPAPRFDSRLWTVDPVEVGPVQEPSTDLLEEAQVSAGHGIKSIEKGELDAGIAWLQSALAFAQNARHARLSAPVKVVMPGVSE